MSVISLGEIYYIVARKKGKEKALEITEDISRLPVDSRFLGNDEMNNNFPANKLLHIYNALKSIHGNFDGI